MSFMFFFCYLFYFLLFWMVVGPLVHDVVMDDDGWRMEWTPDIGKDPQVPFMSDKDLWLETLWNGNCGI